MGRDEEGNRLTRGVLLSGRGECGTEKGEEEEKKKREPTEKCGKGIPWTVQLQERKERRQC